MKTQLIFAVIIGFTFTLTACNKEEVQKPSDEFGIEDAVMILESGYDAKIVTPLEQPSDYHYYTKGLIEYSKNGNLLASVDFGDGTKDVWAKIIRDSSYKHFDLSASKKSAKYTKVITQPLIKINGCNYIVAGTIKYFEGQDWVATVDYGDGTCDEWATKTWKNGTKVFSLQK